MVEERVQRRLTVILTVGTVGCTGIVDEPVTGTLTVVRFGIVMFGDVRSVRVWSMSALVLGGVALVNARTSAGRAR